VPSWHGFEDRDGWPPKRPEPWLQGPLPGVDPLLAQALASFEQVREDLARWIGLLSDEQVWSRPGGLAPLGFQLRHMARSLDRLTTYPDPAATIRKFRIVQAEGKRQVARLVDQAERKLDAFLAFNERDVLKDAGRVSMEIAQRLALDAYQTFERRRLAEEAAAPDELEDAAKQLGPGKPGAGRRRDSRPRS